MLEELESKKGKAPGFMCYAEKAIAGSRHLSDKAFKAYWMTMLWMWAHADDQCSIADTTLAWKIASGMNGRKLTVARAEIMQEDMPLFKRVKGKEGQHDRLVSNGLRKEAAKQKEYRESKTDAANARWAKERAKRLKRGADGISKETAAFCEAHPHYAKLISDLQFRGVTPAQYQKILKLHPKANEGRAVQKALDLAETSSVGVKDAGAFLRYRFSDDEVGSTGGDTRTSSLPKSRKKKDPPQKGKGKSTPF